MPVCCFDAINPEFSRVGDDVFGKVLDPKPFRIEGNFLIYTIEQPDKRVTEQKEEFSITGDKLTFGDSPTSKRVFHRQLRDLAGNAFGSRQVLYERFFASDPLTRARAIAQIYPKKELMDRVLEFLGREDDAE